MTKHDEDLAKSCSSSEVTPDTAALCRTPLRQQYTLLSAHLQMLNKEYVGDATKGCHWFGRWRVLWTAILKSN